jgi:hypothetical protein
MICAKFGKNWSSGSGDVVENVKVYRQTKKKNRQTDGQTHWRIQRGRGSRGRNPPPPGGGEIFVRVG